MIEETHLLLSLWQNGMTINELKDAALSSGEFPSMSARRLRNFVAECFAPRYLVDGGAPAKIIRQLREQLEKRELDQLMYIYTCRANEILADFVREVYWPAYSGGRDFLSIENARSFVVRSNEDGKTTRLWSESTIRRVSSYLIGVCADFGLIESGRRKDRKILPYRIQPKIAAILAYDLHLASIGDNHILSHPDWMLFGMARSDVVDEMKRLALKGMVIVQSVGEAIRIEWRYKSMEELIDVVSES